MAAQLSNDTLTEPSLSNTTISVCDQAACPAITPSHSWAIQLECGERLCVYTRNEHLAFWIFLYPYSCPDRRSKTREPFTKAVRLSKTFKKKWRADFRFRGERPHSSLSKGFRPSFETRSGYSHFPAHE